LWLNNLQVKYVFWVFFRPFLLFFQSFWAKKANKKPSKDLTTLGFTVTPFGFEPKTYCLEGSCSIQLSYGASFYSAWRQLLPSADGLSYGASFYSAWRQLLPSADGLSYGAKFHSAWRQLFFID